MDNIKEKVLIAGGAGFLGSHIVAELIQEYPVCVLEKTGCNLSRICKYGNKIEFFYIDEVDLGHFLQSYPFDYIINCSVSYGVKESLSELIENNVVFPLKLVEASKSTTRAFINTDTFFNKPGNYGYAYLQNYILTKKILEESLQNLNAKIKIINLKLEHLYGPGDNPEKFIPSMINRLKVNEKEIEMTDGYQERDFIYVKDVASAIGIILKNTDRLNNGFTGISAGTGNKTTVRELVYLMKDMLHSSSELKFGTLPYRENEIMHSVGDPSFLMDLGWEIKYDLLNGLTEIIQASSDESR